MNENAKYEVLNGEGDSYFERNVKNTNGKIEVATGCRLFEDFLNNYVQNGGKCLEIGACYGYNLADLCQKYHMECYGIEPSEKAVKYGNEIYDKLNVHLQVGTSDYIPFEDLSFDYVLIGFSWFWVERKMLMKSLAEADRVLKEGGFLVIWDFDTKLPYMRANVHNDNVPTFKMDVASLLYHNPQYVLAEKRSFTHAGVGFDQDIQERCACNIFYKEKIESAYIKG